MINKNMSEAITCHDEVCGDYTSESELACSGGHCDASDKHVCCDTKAKCNPAACMHDPTLELVDGAGNLDCKGLNCNAEDEAVCCQTKPVENATTTAAEEQETTTTSVLEEQETTTTQVQVASTGGVDETIVENGAHTVHALFNVMLLVIVGLLSK